MAQECEVKSVNDETSSQQIIPTQPSSTTANNNVITVNDHQLKTLNIKFQNSDEEELLGSVRTYLTDVTTVRTSARVIHKLREISSASAPSPQPDKKDNTETSANTPKTPSQTKAPHVKVQWTNAERNYFYDALNEYGRDFEKISHFVNMKMRRKSSTDVDYKTKDHVRHLYYQMYSKASKYLRFSSDVTKTAQELYTVINYGEMKRKLIMTEKSFIKLRELVYRGSTTVRQKGKNIRIKTPSCRALRKLNQLEGIDEDVLLPQRIDVVCRPASMKSWGYVQSLAQNPRVKMLSLPLQKRLASLFVSVQQKWQTNNSRMYDKYVSSCIKRQGIQKVGEAIVTQSQSDLTQLKQEEPVLRLMPPKDTPIHRPMVQLNELLSSDNLCLNSYEERIDASERGETLCMEKLTHIKDLQKHAAKRARNDSASDKSAKLLKVENDVKAEVSTTMKIELEAGISVIDYKSNDSNEMISKENLLLQIKSEEITNNEDESPPQPQPQQPVTTAIKTETKTPAANKKKRDALPLIKKQEQNYKPLIDEETLKQVRQGWTLETVGDVTIGDLYLMFGSDCRLTLEYEVTPSNEIKSEIDTKIGSRLKSLVAMATLMEGASNPILTNFFSKHACEKPAGENHIDFKLPKTELYHRMSRKPHPTKWWLPRQRAQVMSALPGNHVIRDLYSTPKPKVENQNQPPNDIPVVVREEEVQKIIEEKIQNISENVNNLSESSRSSMRSLLDCITLNHGTIDNMNMDEESSFSMKLMEAENVRHAYDLDDDIDMSMNSFFCQLEQNTN